MDAGPDFGEWLREQRGASGLTVAEIARRADLSTGPVKDSLRDVPPGRKAVLGLTKVFPAEEEWVASWLAATHARHRTATLFWQAERGPQPIPPGVFDELRAIAVDPGRPAWSRWVAGRMAELGLSRRALARAVDDPDSRGRLTALLDGDSTPAQKTLDRLARVLGVVPDDVLDAANAARHVQNEISQSRRRDRVRRWTKWRLTDHIGAWFTPDSTPGPIRTKLARLNLKAVGTAGFDVLMQAQAMHMGRFVSKDYVPTGPDALGPQPRVSLRRALLALRRRGGRRGLQVRICGECGALALLPDVYARRSWRGRCSTCWRRFTDSPAGRQWAFEVFQALKAGSPAPPAPVPHTTRRGPLPDPDRVAEGLVALVERTLGEGVPDPEGEQSRRIRDAERLLRASSNGRCHRLVAALDELAGDPTHPYRAYHSAAVARRRARSAAKPPSRRAAPPLGECGHRVSSRGVRLCIACYRKTPRPMGTASRRVVEVVATMRAAGERLVGAEIARRAHVSFPTARKLIQEEREPRARRLADILHTVLSDRGQATVAELVQVLVEEGKLPAVEHKAWANYRRVYAVLRHDARFERTGRAEFRFVTNDRPAPIAAVIREPPRGDSETRAAAPLS